MRKILFKSKDGGPDSTVTGYWLCEFKKLFSIVLLRFDNGSRDAYHSHAFHSLNWVLRGAVHELFYAAARDVPLNRLHFPSWLPIFTRRSDFHKVVSCGTTWVLSIRGPWSKTWQEYLPREGATLTLTEGRNIYIG